MTVNQEDLGQIRSWLEPWFLPRNRGIPTLASVYDSTLTVTAATIDITGIPPDYAHLIVELYGRGTASATSVAIVAVVNNDTGANYSTQALIATATSAAAAEALAGTSLNLGSLPAATSPANSFGMCRVDIAHYSGSVNHKAVNAFSSGRETSSSGGVKAQLSSGVWFGTPAAVSRITISPNSGSFAAGTRVTVYGSGV